MRNEIAAFSAFLNTIREILTSNGVSQNAKHDLLKILAWFIIDYFAHNIDLIAQARKNIRPHSTNDDTVIAEQSDYVWDPLFLNFPVDISSQAISTISIHKDYLKIFLLTIDATPLNYNSFLQTINYNSEIHKIIYFHKNRIFQIRHETQ